MSIIHNFKYLPTEDDHQLVTLVIFFCKVNRIQLMTRPTQYFEMFVSTAKSRGILNTYLNRNFPINLPLGSHIVSLGSV